LSSFPRKKTNKFGLLGLNYIISITFAAELWLRILNFKIALKGNRVIDEERFMVCEYSITV